MLQARIALSNQIVVATFKVFVQCSAPYFEKVIHGGFGSTWGRNFYMSVSKLEI